MQSAFRAFGQFVCSAAQKHRGKLKITESQWRSSAETEIPTVSGVAKKPKTSEIAEKIIINQKLNRHPSLVSAIQPLTIGPNTRKSYAVRHERRE